MKMRWCVLALLTLGAVAPLEGQQRQRQRAPGWIGISYDVDYDRRGRPTGVTITEVSDGSPAQEAGLRVGDRVLSVNDLDGPSELAELPQRLRPRAGDRVRMVVRRDGRRREVRMRAAERAPDFVASTALELSFEPDSAVEVMVRAMDSLRTRLIEGRSQNIRITRSQVAGSGAATGRIRVVTSTGGQRGDVEAPFEFFVFRGEDHDSLLQEMGELKQRLADLDARVEERNRQLTRAGSGRARSAQEAEIRRLEAEREDAARRSAVLQAAMADAARATAGFEYSAMAPSADPQRTRVRSEEFRPLTPYLLGRNRVAGAEVIDVKPELAQYFPGVERGVLVVDVAPGTPAAISGIVPGDVIVRLDQVAVSSVEDLRFGVSQAGATLPLSLIRRGSSIQVLLRR